MKKFMFILLSCISLNIHAVNPTQGPLQQNSALCNYGYNLDCNQDNTPAPQKIIRYTTVYLPDKYGAIATDEKTGATTGSINMESLEAAKEAAIAQCRKDRNNRSCKVIGWVRNGCFALVQGKKGNRFVLAKAAEKPGRAEQVAMERCISDGASNCQILIPESCSIP